MKVGPFFYLNNPRITVKGLYAEPIPLDQAVNHNSRLYSPVTHSELLSQIAPGIEISELSRGNVVYDPESKITIIYIDRCIEAHIDEVVRKFNLNEWVVEYDDSYVCPRCDHLVDRF